MIVLETTQELPPIRLAELQSLRVPLFEVCWIQEPK
jgi:hypothetical protein